MTLFVSKRIYERAALSDGYRVLVDRLWPRAVSKEKAAIDDWAKDIAPSAELRKWFGHDSKKYKDFAGRYILEVKNNPKALEIFSNWQKHNKVTLLYGARNEQENEAAVLVAYLGL